MCHAQNADGDGVLWGFVTDVTVVTLGAHVTAPSAKNTPDIRCPVRVPPRSAGGLDPFP